MTISLTRRGHAPGRIVMELGQDLGVQGFEPWTFCLKGSSSTTELHPRRDYGRAQNSLRMRKTGAQAWASAMKTR